MSVCACMEVRGQLQGITSGLLPFQFWGSSSDCQASRKHPCLRVHPTGPLNTVKHQMRSWAVAQSIESWLSMHAAQVPLLVLLLPDIAAFSTRWGKSMEDQKCMVILSHTGTFKARLGDVRPNLKNKQKNNNKSRREDFGDNKNMCLPSVTINGLVDTFPSCSL